MVIERNGIWRDDVGEEGDIDDGGQESQIANGDRGKEAVAEDGGPNAQKRTATTVRPINEHKRTWLNFHTSDVGCGGVGHPTVAGPS